MMMSRLNRTCFNIYLVAGMAGSGAAVITNPHLTGVAYYENPTAEGITEGASFAGGTEIVFYGEGMAADPSGIQVIFSSSQLGTVQGGPPTLSKDFFILIFVA